jgi:predicted secreted protein
MNWLQGTFNYTFILSAALMAATGNGCAQSPEIDPVNTQRYTIQDSTIKASVGEEFSIVIESNPTTGYSWKFAEPLDNTVIKLIGEEFLPPDNLRKGAPGKQLWTFQAEGEGETTISLEYLRPWEKGKQPARVATFTVIAEKAANTGSDIPNPE